MREITADIDEFAVSLTLLVSTSLEGVKKNTSKAVAASTRVGAKKARENAASGIGVHPWSKEYTEGFQGHVSHGGDISKGEIGNKNKPGLVHLLEHGHATLNGGRTRAFPHMEPTREFVEEDLRERLAIAVENGLVM